MSHAGAGLDPPGRVVPYGGRGARPSRGGERHAARAARAGRWIASGHVVTKVGILSPVAEAIYRPDARPISARLKSLRGAKIVVVDNSFESSRVLHDELKQLLLERGVEPLGIVKKSPGTRRGLWRAKASRRRGCGSTSTSTRACP